MRNLYRHIYVFKMEINREVEDVHLGYSISEKEMFE